MNEPYLRSYAALGLKPGSDWQEIRDAYRALIKKWHPDRFQQDSNNRKIAEEESMEITRAYKILADYYREHGATPTHPGIMPITPAHAPEAAVSPEHTQPATVVDDVSTGDAHPSHPTPAPVAARAGQWKALLALSVIALFFYFWPPVSTEHDPNIGAVPSPAVQNVNRPTADGQAASHPADQFFTLGSKLGTVYAIQGVPSKTEPGIWHYGKSRVYFLNGSVTRWDSHPEHPLQASLHVDPVVANKAFIERGSTKDEVLALQGTPWRQTDREWVYGASRIFFSGERVIGWEESSMHPLKIQR